MTTATAPVAPLVSIIVPVFNGERFLEAALRSASEQTYRATELIVVDDGSTDGSADVARSFPNAVLICREHEGLPATRNAGVSAARGDFLAFLDADDLIPPDKLSKQVTYLLNHPGLGCVFGRREVVSEGVIDSSWMRWGPDWQQRVQIQPMSMVVRRAVFDQVGPFDVRLPVSDDADWVLRAMEAGVPMYTLDDVVLYRRAHDGNLSRDPADRRRAYFELLKARIERARASSCE